MKRNSAIRYVVIFAVVLLVLLGFKGFFAPSTQEGSKSITIEVVDDKGEKTSYDVKTDAEYLRGAMEETKGLEFSGDDSEYGLMVIVVNGVTADYNVDGSYWAFYVNDEYCQYGVDEQPVNDKDVFKIEYTK